MMIFKVVLLLINAAIFLKEISKIGRSEVDGKVLFLSALATELLGIYLLLSLIKQGV